MEMVAGAGVTAADLFLRALRVRQYHRARNSDVRAVSGCDTRSRNADVSGRPLVGLLFKPGCISHSLRYHARADILRRRLHHATNLVGRGSDYVADNDHRVESYWVHMVEDSQTLVTNMAGYSGTPLAKKLGIKEGSRIALVNAPKDFQTELGELPDGVKFLKPSTKPLDLILFFVLSERVLARDFAKLADRLAANGMIWIAWPKKSSGVTTDLAFERVQRIGLDAGLVDVKICAVDETWSGLKFVYRLKDRSSRN